MADIVHLLKEKTGKKVTTKCGRTVAWATIWNCDVTCSACLPRRKKRVIRRKNTSSA